MIFKRAAAKLKAQDWTAIGIELVIVIIGVFIGTQVSNSNNADFGASLLNPINSCAELRAWSEGLGQEV